LLPSALLDRVEAAAGPLLKACERKDVNYCFFVFDSDEVVAFSRPGGSIYVSRGVFHLAANDVELAWVVGHEIAHVELRHGTTAPSEGRHALTPEEEHTADEWVTRRLLALGHSRRECLSFLRRYRNFLEGAGRAEKTPSTTPGATMPKADRHGSNLPAPETRLRRLEKLSLETETGTTASRGDARHETGASHFPVDGGRPPRLQ
jgi:hypothetical protein